MKKVVVGVLIALLFIAGGAGAYLVLTNQQKVNDTTGTQSNSSSSSSTVNACDVLTEKIVKDVVGQDVQKVAAPAATLGNADNTISSCNYITKLNTSTSTAEGPKLSGASLLVYVAKTKAGAESNKTQFSQLGSEVQKVDGVGDAAFYNPQFRQLHVLKGSNWYVVTSYKDSILNSTLESNKALAQKLKFE
jgi:hypothetical protein